mgnify:FL=1
MPNIGSSESVLKTEDLYRILSERKPGETIYIKGRVIENADLSEKDLRGIDFSETTFTNVKFDGADMDGCNIFKTWFTDCSLRNVKLTNANAREAGFRFQDLTGIDISGTDIFGSILEYAKLDGLKYDDRTQHYKLRCPEEGAFIGWKCCIGLRVVRLLIPADARRVSATMDTCRCDKAKVLSIKSIDETKDYEWAQSTVDQDFYYEVGKWVEPANYFEPDRWKDSSPGVHFFMEREECIAYMTK